MARLPVVIVPAGERPPREDAHARMSAAERILLVAELTRHAWALRGVNVDDRRDPRAHLRIVLAPGREP